MLDENYRSYPRMSALRGIIRQICNWIPGQKSNKRSNMPSETETCIATDELHHRYGDAAVLRKILVGMGFKDKDIKIIVCIDLR